MDTGVCDRTDSHYLVNQFTRNLGEGKWRSCSSDARDGEAEPTRQVNKLTMLVKERLPSANSGKPWSL